MDSTSEALLIIVSATLSVFLLVTIVAVVKFIQILNHVKKITESAEKIADNAENVSDFFQKTAGPAAVAKLVSNILSSFHAKSKSKKG